MTAFLNRFVIVMLVATSAFGLISCSAMGRSPILPAPVGETVVTTSTLGISRQSNRALLTPQKREEILALYKDLRLADVNDGMDALGLVNTGNVDGEIKPLWRDTENFTHKFCGFALTMRLLPTNQPIAFNQRSGTLDQYLAEKKKWYGKDGLGYYLGLKWEIKKGDVVVVDCDARNDVGYLGSENTLEMVNRGAVGAVTNGGIRDTDELTKTKIPVYAGHIAKGIRPSRAEFDAMNIPVSVGGVKVVPGDLVFADGDGVIVVPFEHVYTVAKIAREVHGKDVEMRKQHYEKAGRAADSTLR